MGKLKFFYLLNKSASAVRFISILHTQIISAIYTIVRYPNP